MFYFSIAEMQTKNCRAKSLKFVLQVMDYPFIEIKTSFLPYFINLTTLVAI
jgi:hypothetical protein